MDEALAGRILPELIAIGQAAPLEQLPHVPQLLPLLHMLHQHVKMDCTAPIPIALTFGLHAMLTAMLVLQGGGNGDLARLASFTKQSYHKLFSQLQDVEDPTSKSQPQNAPTFYDNVQLFGNVVHLAEPILVSSNNIPRGLAVSDPSETERLAIWNPVVGGSYLLYGTYICSIALGSATIDSLGQLCMTLHLYNALKSQLRSSLDIPFLEHLGKVFSKTRAVWAAGRTVESGSFSKEFWMAWGMSSEQALQQQNYNSLDDEQFDTWMQRSITSRLSGQGLRYDVFVLSTSWGIFETLTNDGTFVFFFCSQDTPRNQARRV